MKKISILLADDHELVRAGIHSLLRQIPNVKVVAEADNGKQALELAIEHRPDIILMDISMKEMNGLESTVRILEKLPEIHVIILSMHANEEYVMQALRVGASGYLLKDAAFSDLERAIKSVSKGETYLSPAIPKQVVEAYKQHDNSEQSPFRKLTARQREILQLIAEGKTTKEIAFMLNLSPKTIETHRIQLMERLGIHDIPGLVRYAINKGLVTTDK